ncbi:MAG: hypothetical protein LUG96_13795 [Tannerellaceae bacterium]|nr:hypothetical protein [Tannerellaceae bacterium]
MKINLKDTTFIIPIRVDSIIRLENLFLSIDSVLNYFETNIIILEAASYNNGLIKFFLKGKGTYNFIEDNDPIFHKTKYLNIMAKKVTTPYIAIWDVDIILDPHQIIDAIQQLREEKCDVAYPYSGTFLDTSDILRKHYLIHQDLDFLKKNSAKMNSLYTVEGVLGAVGGAVFIKTNKYFYAGMENENFYGWGLEDGERHYR